MVVADFIAQPGGVDTGVLAQGCCRCFDDEVVERQFDGGHLVEAGAQRDGVAHIDFNSEVEVGGGEHALAQAAGDDFPHLAERCVVVVAAIGGGSGVERRYSDGRCRFGRMDGGCRLWSRGGGSGRLCGGFYIPFDDASMITGALYRLQVHADLLCYVAGQRRSFDALVRSGGRGCRSGCRFRGRMDRGRGGC